MSRCQTALSDDVTDARKGVRQLPAISERPRLVSIITQPITISEFDAKFDLNTKSTCRPCRDSLEERQLSYDAISSCNCAVYTQSGTVVGSATSEAMRTGLDSATKLAFGEMTRRLENPDIILRPQASGL